MPNRRITPFERLFPRKKRLIPTRLWIALAVVLLVLALFVFVWWKFFTKRVIASSGGFYFRHPVELAVPPFRQGDPRWHADPLGDTTDTIGSAGCALTSAAMVLKWYGVDTDPKRLNAYLTAHQGYVGTGYLVWEKAAELGKGTLEKAYEDLPSYWRIDRELIRRNPVIVRLHFPDGMTHFVVIAGKRGYDYLIVDPGAGWSKGLYPLRDLTPEIDGLRYYRRKTPR